MPKPKPGQAPLYKGTFDCAMTTVRKEVFRSIHTHTTASLGKRYLDLYIHTLLSV